MSERRSEAGQEEGDIAAQGRSQQVPSAAPGFPAAEPLIPQHVSEQDGMAHVEAWAATGTNTVAATDNASAARTAMPNLILKRPPGRTSGSMTDAIGVPTIPPGVFF